MASRLAQLKQMKVAEDSAQIAADVGNRFEVGITIQKLQKGIVHQVFGALTLSMRDIQSASNQPRVMFEEEFLPESVLTVAGTVGDYRPEVENCHLQTSCRGEPVSDRSLVNIP
jgi:hypothetical protein